MHDPGRANGFSLHILLDRIVGFSLLFFMLFVLFINMKRQLLHSSENSHLPNSGSFPTQNLQTLGSFHQSLRQPSIGSRKEILTVLGTSNPVLRETGSKKFLARPTASSATSSPATLIATAMNVAAKVMHNLHRTLNASFDLHLV